MFLQLTEKNLIIKKLLYTKLSQIFKKIIKKLKNKSTRIS